MTKNSSEAWNEESYRIDQHVMETTWRDNRPDIHREREYIANFAASVATTP